MFKKPPKGSTRIIVLPGTVIGTREYFVETSMDVSTDWAAMLVKQGRARIPDKKEKPASAVLPAIYAATYAEAQDEAVISLHGRAIMRLSPLKDDCPIRDYATRIADLLNESQLGDFPQPRRRK
jgi:hypothetical protein